jgi:hypothetical protein
MGACLSDGMRVIDIRSNAFCPNDVVPLKKMQFYKPLRIHGKPFETFFIVILHLRQMNEDLKPIAAVAHHIIPTPRGTRVLYHKLFTAAIFSVL